MVSDTNPKASPDGLLPPGAASAMKENPLPPIPNSNDEANILINTTKLEVSIALT
jgi:hypothetical protein